MSSFVSFFAVLLSLSVTWGKVQQSSEKSLVILNVEKREICANKGDTVTISCTLAVHGETSVNNWTLSWYSEIHGEMTKNATEIRRNSSHLTSYLKLDAVWSGERRFTCVIASRFSDDDKRLVKAALNSTSVVKVKPPTGCDIIGFRYLEKPQAHFPEFEVYWKPMKSLETLTAYTVNFCTEKTWFGLPTPYVCPLYHSINGSCAHREMDVYNVPNTKGFTCMASVSTTSYTSLTRLLTEFVTSRVYIGSMDEGESCEHRCSNEKKFVLRGFHEPFTEENDVTEVALIPPGITGLSVTVARQVTLTWSDSLAKRYVRSREYAVRYTCSRDLTWNSTAYSITKKLILNREDFQNYRHYDLCRFCVMARMMAQLHGGQHSEPLCINVRLPEEPPSSPPNITCRSDTCPSTRDDHVRNVSVTWALPPRRDWNGLLTELRVSYLEKSQGNASNYSDYVIRVPIGNDTSNGETILTGLSLGRTYWIKMVVCNKKGCSRPGKTLKISPALSLIITESNESENTILTRPYILASCIAGAFLAAYLVYLTYTYESARRRLRPRLELRLCEQSGYDVIVENTKKNEYDVLVVLDSTTRQMNVYTTPPLRCPQA